MFTIVYKILLTFLTFPVDFNKKSKGVLELFR